MLRRRGFGLIEVIVMLAVASILVTVAVSALVRADQIHRIQETWTILEDTRLALFSPAGGNKAFRQRVTVNTLKISSIIYPITKTSLTSCNTTKFNQGDVNNWTNWGPFGNFTIDSTVGLPTPMGIVSDTLVRSPPNGGAGTHRMVMRNVDLEDARLLDAFYDNADLDAAGVVQWAPAGSSPTTMTYQWPIDASC